MSLGRIDYQIFWLFSMGDTLTDLSQLKGKRIGLGAEGSGDRAVCEKILAVAGITYDNTTFTASHRKLSSITSTVEPSMRFFATFLQSRPSSMRC